MPKKMVPPDGGYGWVIVFAYALNHLIFVPVMQSFGLVFKDTFVEMGFTATDGSIIINTNAAASMMTGLINGPLLKYFGCRKVSYAGAFFTTLGVLLTAYANSFSSFLVTYGIITSLGMGMGMSSYPLALNTYFVKRRSKAAGITMTITGLGPVFMPQLISLLLFLYGVYGCVIVLGGVAAHSFIAASLLQPVKWHMVEEVPDEEKADEENNVKNGETMSTLLESPEKETNGMYDKQNEIMQSLASLDHEVHAIYEMGTPLGSVLSLNQVGTRQRLSSVNFKSIQEYKWPSVSSINKKTEIRNGDAKQNPNETTNEKYTIDQPEKPCNPEMTVTIPDDKKQDDDGLVKMVLAKIVNMFDLELLKDPIYVNIMVGMSLAVFAEINFSFQTPFILVDFNMSTYEIATFLSVQSIADICFRFLAPFIGDFLNKPARIMYMFSLLFLMATRFSMFLFTDYYRLLGVAVALGIAKGVRTVYYTLVIPNYVPIEKLPNALGLQMMVNGIFVLFGGPILGMIRDATGSYKNGIFVLNLVTITTVIMWSIEMLYLRYKSKRVQES